MNRRHALKASPHAVEFSERQKAAAQELAPILPQLRRETARLLDKAPLVGELVDVDESVGRHAPCWLYRAGGFEMGAQGASAPHPVVFEVHGGGFATGDARREDALCAWIRDSFEVHAVAVEYRKAPEHPYPAALEDVLATIAFFLEHAEAYGMDPQRFYVMGCSAGANLAVAAALKLAAVGPCPLAGCVLHYPFFDAAAQAREAGEQPGSVGVSGDDGFAAESNRGAEASGEAVEAEPEADERSLPERLMEAFDVWYVGDADASSPFISPVYAAESLLKNLPFMALYPVVGDALMGDAQRFAARLAQAQAPFSFHPVRDAYHGYVEDAANVEVYRATTMPETIAARPADFVGVAERMVRASLAEVLGPAKRIIPFEEG